jgi:hypothetical protein
MNKLFLFFFLTTALLFTSCNSSDNTQIPKPVPPKSEGTIRVLFVGNSHTEYYASFPLMLDALAKANNKQVEVEALLEMGVSIDKNLAANKKEADELFAQTDTDGNYFDYIILQESTPVAAQYENKYIDNCKSIHALVAKNSPDVATYIYELMMPDDYTSSDYKEWQETLTQNAIKVAESLPNAGVLRFASTLGQAYQGKEGYSAMQNGKDMLRYTDNSRHMLNDAVFLNSIVLYQTLFNETPTIPQQLPLATGTGDNDEIVFMDVKQGVSNPDALIKIAAAYQ